MTNTARQLWRGAMLCAVALFAATAPLVAAAPRAHAGPDPSDGFYLDILNGLPVSDRFSTQTLLQEGHKACSAMKRDGVSEDSATDMVRSDLRISTYEAYRLVAAAELGLACFSPKVHGQQ